MASIIMTEFYVIVKTHFKPLVILKLMKNNIKENTSSFENLHEILYIVSAIYIIIFQLLAHKIDPTSFYYHKRFHFTSIQGNVNTICTLWDYDYGCKCIHNWVFFKQKKRFRKSCDERQTFYLTSY